MVLWSSVHDRKLLQFYHSLFRDFFTERHQWLNGQCVVRKGTRRTRRQRHRQLSLIGRKVPKNETCVITLHNNGQLLKQERGLSVVLSDVVHDVSLNLQHQLYGLMTHEPAVTIATEKNTCMCVFWGSWYFAVLLSVACLAAAPCSTDVKLKWNSAKISGTATSRSGT